jgi:hypothetical protein
MIYELLVPLTVIAALGYGLRSGRNGKAIAKRPYNNRYNDAAGAREEHVG